MNAMHTSVFSLFLASHPGMLHWPIHGSTHEEMKVYAEDVDEKMLRIRTNMIALGLRTTPGRTMREPIR
jgi:hypothetical protein